MREGQDNKTNHRSPTHPASHIEAIWNPMVWKRPGFHNLLYHMETNPALWSKYPESYYEHCLNEAIRSAAVEYYFYAMPEEKSSERERWHVPDVKNPPSTSHTDSSVSASKKAKKRKVKKNKAKKKLNF